MLHTVNTRHETRCLARLTTQKCGPTRTRYVWVCFRVTPGVQVSKIHVQMHEVYGTQFAEPSKSNNRITYRRPSGAGSSSMATLVLAEPRLAQLLIVVADADAAASSPRLTDPRCSSLPDAGASSSLPGVRTKDVTGSNVQASSGERCRSPMAAGASLCCGVVVLFAPGGARRKNAAELFRFRVCTIFRS